MTAFEGEQLPSEQSRESFALQRIRNAVALTKTSPDYEGAVHVIAQVLEDYDKK